VKTPTLAFNTRLPKIAGEKPLILAKIYYDDSNFFLCSTERVKIESDIYNPWVVNFGTLNMEISEGVHFAPPNQIDITLVRNSTTENLLGAYTKFKKVQLWQWFESLSLWNDALESGTFVIDKITNIELGQFTISCISDEGLFLDDIPKEQLNSTDYPMIPLDNEGLPWPTILGDMKMSSSEENRYLRAYRHKACVARCIDMNTMKFLVHRHPSVNCQSIDYGCEVIQAEQGLAGSIEKFASNLMEGQKNWDEISGDYYRIADLKPYDSTNKGYGRIIRILPRHPWSDNNVADWYNACDLDILTYAHLSGTNRMLSLGFLFKIDCGNIGQYKPDGITYYYRILVACNIVELSGGIVWLRYGVGGTQHLEQGFTTTGYHITSSYIQSAVPLNLYLNWVQAEVTSGNSASIDGLHFYIEFWSELEPTRTKLIPTAPKRQETNLRRGIEFLRESLEPSQKLSNILIEGEGPADQSGQLGPSSHPLTILYFILTKMVGVPGSEIDLSSWTPIHSRYGSFWIFGKCVPEKVNPKEFINTLLHESMLGLYRGADNKFKLFEINYANPSPNMVFSNKKGDVYLMKNFNWGYTDAFYNRFNLKFWWSWVASFFQEDYLKDRANDYTPYAESLLESYEKYGVESSYPFEEFEFIYDKAVMDLIFAKLKKYWKQLKIWIEFDTSLVGCLLELGDTIQVDHSAQTWAQASKNFQVTKIEQNNNRVHVKAIEVIP